MKFKLFFIFIFIFLLNSCANYQISEKKEKTKEQYYFSQGFALIYDDDFYKEKIINKKINNDEIIVMHTYLEINTPVKIINPVNSSFIETKIKKKANYPKIFNVVISKKIANMLNLDYENPYIEVLEFKKNKTFVAKKANIFDEEKNVAKNAPVTEVRMDDISIKKSNENKKEKIKENTFYLIISDFYFINSAENLKKDLINKTKINNFSVKKIKNNLYRLYAGPFKNFNALKSTYISLNSLGFDDLNVYKNLP